ncbi:MAG: 1-acyl-sn-glycerol-3-phosphate acyltransferase [Prevotella sp.]|nr:1-acyl-sn-glycerol-3-phosphate acyltransferase [Prevotella sp.]
MVQRFCAWLLYKKMGWTKDITVDIPKKFVICLAPHTSNWDFVIGRLYAHAEGMPINYLMKKEWFFWPLGPIFRHYGGIPVYRNKNTSMTDSLAKAAEEADVFRLCITPEGTRSRNPHWRKGFYFIALKAEMPVLLYGLDYERKLIQCTETFVPTGDVERDMQEIKKYYVNFKGRHPEKFAI